jgi:L-ascorbate metabolism protein UlaG (beta-lactamase superfamily)
VLITHAHYDHCDMQAFAAYRDRDVPLCVAATVTGEAGKHGFGNVTPLEPWQHAEADGVSITAAPAKLGVPEVTYVLRSG